jgi:hypothetical protein
VFDPFTPVLSDLFSFGQGVLRRDLSLLLERPVGAAMPGAAGHILFLVRLRFEHLFRALQLIIAEAMLRGALDVVYGVARQSKFRWESPEPAMHASSF